MGIISAFFAIPGLIAGLFGTINGITTAISNEKIALITAKTDDQRIASTERIDALRQRRDVLIAEAGASRLNIIVRSAMGFSVAIVLAKLFVWDKVIGSLVGCSQAPVGTCGIFVTDPLDDNQWHVIMVVIGFYFLYEGGTAITRVVASRLGT